MIPEEIEFCTQKSSFQRRARDLTPRIALVANNLRQHLAQMPKNKTQKSPSLAQLCAGKCNKNMQNAAHKKRGVSVSIVGGKFGLMEV